MREIDPAYTSPNVDGCRYANTNDLLKYSELINKKIAEAYELLQKTLDEYGVNIKVKEAIPPQNLILVRHENQNLGGQYKSANNIIEINANNILPEGFNFADFCKQHKIENVDENELIKTLFNKSFLTTLIHELLHAVSRNRGSVIGVDYSFLGIALNEAIVDDWAKDIVEGPNSFSYKENSNGMYGIFKTALQQIIKKINGQINPEPYSNPNNDRYEKNIADLKRIFRLSLFNNKATKLINIVLGPKVLVLLANLERIVATAKKNSGTLDFENDYYPNYYQNLEERIDFTDDHNSYLTVEYLLALHWKDVLKLLEQCVDIDTPGRVAKYWPKSIPQKSHYKYFLSRNYTPAKMLIRDQAYARLVTGSYENRISTRTINDSENPQNNNHIFKPRTEYQIIQEKEVDILNISVCLYEGVIIERKIKIPLNNEIITLLEQIINLDLSPDSEKYQENFQELQDISFKLRMTKPYYLNLQTVAGGEKLSRNSDLVYPEYALEIANKLLEIHNNNYSQV